MGMRAWLSALAVVGGAAGLNAWTAPTPLMVLPIGWFGPNNTRINHGYEGARAISPILPHSYSATQAPQQLGLQFIGDAPENLRRDRFIIQVTAPGGQHASTSPTIFSQGFSGWNPGGKWHPGPYQIRFHLTGFPTSAPTWTITLTPASAPWGDRPSETSTIAVQSLNTLRTSLRLDPVNWDGALQQASRAQVQYLAVNGFSHPSFHDQSPGRPGFTGQTPWARDQRFGWPTPDSGEVGMEWSDPLESPTVSQDFVDTVFHRLSLLSANLISVGAWTQSGRNGSLVMDLGFGYRDNLPVAIVYPFNGEMGLPTSWYDIESPDPVPSGAGHTYGYPITVDFPTALRLNRVQASLYRGWRPIGIWFDAPGHNEMGANQVGMVPRRPLAPDAIYTVTIRAVAAFADGTRRLVHLESHFATGQADQSLAAAIVSPDRVVISDVRAGSGVPEPAVLVRLFRAEGQTLTAVAVGTTNREGLWTADRPPSPAGWYQARSASGNAVLFWWGNRGS